MLRHIAHGVTDAGAKHTIQREAAMRDLVSMLLLLTALLLSACAAPVASAGNDRPAEPVAAVAATPTPWSVELPPVLPGGLVHLALPSRGTPQSDATMTVESVIFDAVTKRPAPASVYVIAGETLREPLPSELLAHNVVAFELALPPTLTSWLLVRSEGYQDWAVKLDYHIKTSRTMQGSVELVRMMGEGL